MSCCPDLIAASIYDKYSACPSFRQICTRCRFTMPNMIQVCSNFHRDRLCVIIYIRMTSAQSGCQNDGFATDTGNQNVTDTGNQVAVTPPFSRAQARVGGRTPIRATKFISTTQPTPSVHKGVDPTSARRRVEPDSLARAGPLRIKAIDKDDLIAGGAETRLRSGTIRTGSP